MNRRGTDGQDPPRGRSGLGGPARPGTWVLGGGIGRRPAGPDRRALYGSFTVHIVLAVGVVLAGVLGVNKLPEFETYRITLFSPPPQVEGPPAPQPEVAPAIVSQPTVERPPEPRPAVREAPKPEQTPVDSVVEKPKDPEPVAGTNPDPESTGGENLDVNIAGQDFPFPEYLQNIIRQVNRFFRWTGSGEPTAVVVFYISRDGSVGGLDVAQKSADFRFNLETMSAVEQAGKAGAFGPLPEGWAQDRLWVRFRFIPPGT